jgi:hypothetical protein
MEYIKNLNFHTASAHLIAICGTGYYLYKDHQLSKKNRFETKEILRKKEEKRSELPFYIFAAGVVTYFGINFLKSILS